MFNPKGGQHSYNQPLQQQQPHYSKTGPGWNADGSKYSTGTVQTGADTYTESEFSPAGSPRHRGNTAGNACCGAVFGVVLFLLAFPALFWNEGSAVATARALEEAMSVVVGATASEAYPHNDNALVHVAGDLVLQTLTDPLFGVTAEGVSLHRNVEMLQWVEHKRKTKKRHRDGSEEEITSYSYEKEWKSRAINSGKFHMTGYDNPAFTFRGDTFQASHVKLGAFTLSPSLQKQISSSHSIPLPNLQGPVGGYTWYNDGQYLMSAPTEILGTFRVSFSVVGIQSVSVIARQTAGGGFQEYTTTNGRTIDMLSEGIVSAHQMLSEAQSRNTMSTWGLRVAFFFMMFLGLRLMFSPLDYILRIVPIFGSMLSSLANFGLGVACFLVSVSLSCITIAVAWIYYRPMVAGSLLAIALVPVIFSYSQGVTATARDKSH